MRIDTSTPFAHTQRGYRKRRAMAGDQTGAPEQAPPPLPDFADGIGWHLFFKHTPPITLHALAGLVHHDNSHWLESFLTRHGVTGEKPHLPAELRERVMVACPELRPALTALRKTVAVLMASVPSDEPGTEPHNRKEIFRWEAETACSQDDNFSKREGADQALEYLLDDLVSGTTWGEIHHHSLRPRKSVPGVLKFNTPSKEQREKRIPWPRWIGRVYVTAGLMFNDVSPDANHPLHKLAISPDLCIALGNCIMRARYTRPATGKPIRAAHTFTVSADDDLALDTKIVLAAIESLNACGKPTMAHALKISLEGAPLVPRIPGPKPEASPLKNHVIGGFLFQLTSDACPEQYRVFRECYEQDGQVAYVRLRHGELRADVPVSGGATIYAKDGLGGFGHDGQFADEESRVMYLTEIAGAIAAHQKSITDSARAEAATPETDRIAAFGAHLEHYETDELPLCFERVEVTDLGAVYHVRNLDTVVATVHVGAHTVSAVTGQSGQVGTVFYETTRKADAGHELGAHFDNIARAYLMGPALPEHYAAANGLEFHRVRLTENSADYRVARGDSAVTLASVAVERDETAEHATAVRCWMGTDPANTPVYEEARGNLVPERHFDRIAVKVQEAAESPA